MESVKEEVILQTFNLKIKASNNTAEKQLNVEFFLPMQTICLDEFFTHIFAMANTSTHPA
jgi:hypothetical protein